ncbi:MAG: major capsid protein [Thermoplasmatales archaeon]
MLQPRVGKNAFNLSYDKKVSLKFGQLVPIHVQETLPGDIFKGQSQTLLRFAPMMAPIMHRVDVYVHFFYVPNRILWKNWENWITGNDDEAVPPWFTVPYSGVYAQNGTVLDHLGMPSSETPGVVYDDVDADQYPEKQFNALPVAAYQRIWYEYYRDQNLEFPDSTVQDCMLVDGENVFQEGTLEEGSMIPSIRYRSWQKDYFTSALPWPQKGDMALLPISGDITMKDPDPNVGTAIRNLSDNSFAAPVGANLIKGGSGQFGRETWTTPAERLYDVWLDSSKKYKLGDSNTTIEDLRRAARMQEWLERNARGGTRYVESIYSHFNERVKDYRLDRPEYIGGGRQRVNISEVLQTSETNDTPQGEMAGHGISAGRSGGYNYRCNEHGWIIGIMSVMPKAAYYQGVPRYFGARKDRLDYYWPSFAHLGEQAIQNKELFLDLQSVEVGMEDTFGYTPRYAEYRMNYSTVAGDFNSSLDFWHLARKFSNPPALNHQFVHVNDSDVYGDLDRIFAVKDGTDYLWAHVYHDIMAIRPIPKFAIPTL